MRFSDTIFAPATLKGQSGLSVVRVSGPSVETVLRRIAGKLPEPRYMVLCDLVDPRDGFRIDEALVVRFEEGASFTGEPVAEFQVHGSVAVVDALCSAIGAMDECRYAEEGEFTARAFRNGRMDLTQVEGLADLIAAETREQHKLANRVFSGALGEAVNSWREGLLQAQATLEATIDFSDEELPEGLLEKAREDLKSLIADLDLELNGYPAARRLRDGLEVAIVGKPNVGKSTLLNRLAGREAAITSSVAGTTRDVVEVRLNIAGRSVLVLDTAGIREATDSVERIGVSRTMERAAQADIRVFLVERLDEVTEFGVDVGSDDLVVLSKVDKNPEAKEFGVSGLTGQGVEHLFNELEERVVKLSSGGSKISQERQRVAVETAKLEAVAALSFLDDGLENVDLSAEHLRSSVLALDSLVGRIDVEDVLGQIFSRFCIGK